MNLLSCLKEQIVQRPQQPVSDLIPWSRVDELSKLHQRMVDERVASPRGRISIVEEWSTLELARVEFNMSDGDCRNLRKLDSFNRFQRRWLEDSRESYGTPASQPEIDQMVETRLGENIDTLRQQQGAIGRVIRFVGL